jgi:hypothetical protein
LVIRIHCLIDNLYYCFAERKNLLIRVAGGFDHSKSKTSTPMKKKTNSLVPPAPIIGMSGAMSSQSSKSPARLTARLASAAASASASSSSLPAAKAAVAASLHASSSSSSVKSKAATPASKAAPRRQVHHDDESDDDAFADCKALAVDDWVVSKPAAPKAKPQRGAPVPVGMAPAVCSPPGRGQARPVSAPSRK